MAVPKPDNALDVLQQMFNDVLVQTGKVLRASTKDSKGALVQANVIVGDRISSSIDTFHDALDDLESEIVRAKSVLLRDLDELRAKTSAPAPATASNVPAVAPPAPMEIDLESPDPNVPAAAGSTDEATQPTQAEIKTVAPFPNMGLDPAGSPETTPAPTPPTTALVQASQVKSSPQVAAAKATIAGRPSDTAPSQKGPDATNSGQQPGSGAATPQPPVSAPVAPGTGTSATATASASAHTTTPAHAPTPPAQAPTPPDPAPAPAPAPTQTSQSTPPQATVSEPGPVPAPAPANAPATPDAEMAFTDMALSVDPSANEPQSQSRSQQSEDAMSFSLPGSGASANRAPDLGATAGEPINIDAEIEGLFNSTRPPSAEKMDMDYDLGGIGLDSNNSFDDMFFDNTDDNNADDTNDAYTFSL